MNIPEPRQATYYVVFAKRRGPWSWKSLLSRKGMEHCYVVGRWGTSWVCINPLENGADISITDQLALVKAGFQDYPEYIHTYLKDELILEVNTWTSPRPVSFMVPLTCVSVVKYVMGLKAKAVTPWGLYNELIEKFGARPV